MIEDIVYKLRHFDEAHGQNEATKICAEIYDILQPLSFNKLHERVVNEFESIDDKYGIVLIEKHSNDKTEKTLKVDYSYRWYTSDYHCFLEVIDIEEGQCKLVRFQDRKEENGNSNGQVITYARVMEIIEGWVRH